MKQVAVEVCDTFSYPTKKSLFRPSERYPEYPSQWEITDKEKNVVYDCVRSAFIRMGYDKEKLGTPAWNPLGEIVHKGDVVLIKPNLVMDYNGSGDTVECLYTQPGVIAAVIDYVVIALNGSGKIIVGDAPMQGCNFEKLIKQSGLKRLIDYYQNKGVEIRLVDFRGIVTEIVNGIEHYTERQKVGKKVDLEEESEFSVLSPEENLRLRKGANDPNDLHMHHNAKKHEYEVCNELLQADVLIDMPKPKLHMKAGVTISLKNMVGINVRKEYLPHHMEGDKESGRGDAYLKKSVLKRMRANARDKAYVLSIKKKYTSAFLITQVRRACALLVKLFFKDKLTQGTWYGNETISKTVIDLNKIAIYADKNGVLRDIPQRKRLIVADMIISGEKMGPLSPTAKNVGIIAVGEDPVCFDECIAALMGANISKIPTLVNARHSVGQYKITASDSIGVILSNKADWDGKYVSEISAKDTLKFKPIDSWKVAFYDS